MEKKDLSSWDELEIEVNKLYEFLKAKQSSACGHISKPLFRGQRSSKWTLKTTLERYLNREVLAEEYNCYLDSIKPAIESYTKSKWSTEINHQIFDTLHCPPLNYPFMSYVRHHGFPSPLLDWTQSLYIALFFAYHNASIEQRVSVYAYVELCGSGKHGSLDGPRIHGFGPYITTDKRHFMQQCEYTICVKKQNNSWVYCSYENIFLNTKAEEDQDYLIQFTLPGNIKNDVLRKLQTMNINAFTLFGDEDSLMDMLAFKEILSKKST
jgi:hypothetical protein